MKRTDLKWEKISNNMINYRNDNPPGCPRNTLRLTRRRTGCRSLNICRLHRDATSKRNRRYCPRRLPLPLLSPKSQPAKIQGKVNKNATARYLATRWLEIRSYLLYLLGGVRVCPNGPPHMTVHAEYPCPPRALLQARRRARDTQASTEGGSPGASAGCRASGVVLR